MMDVVVEVRVSTLPVLTSVMLIRYSVIMPFKLLARGGDHDKEMEVELAADTANPSGALDGARRRTRIINIG